MTLTRLAAPLALVNLVVLAVIVVRGGAVTAQDAVQPVLRAQLIELVDGNGVMRAQFKTEDSGTVVLRLTDQEGTIRVKLAADAMGSGLLLADDQTEVGVHILSGISLLTQERATAITLAEPGGARRVISAGDE